MKLWAKYYKFIALWMTSLLPMALPLYLVRFKIGLLPTTLLEMYLFVWFVVASMGYGMNIWKNWQGRWSIILWVVASLAAVFWSPSIVTGLGLWRAYVLEPVLVFVLLFGLREVIDRKRLEYAMCGVIGVVGLWALIQFVTGQGIPSPWNVSIADGRRATGPFPYPNALALFVVPMGAYLFSRFFNTSPSVPLLRKEREDWFMLVGWAMVGLSALLAKSDGGMLALACATWFVLVVRKETRRFAIVIAVLGIVVVTLVAPVRNAFMEQATFSGWSGRVRTWTWTETWNMLKDRPILGAGFGGYPIVFEPYHEKTFIEIFQYPHTIVFNVWTETGLVGLFAFGWIVVMWIRKRVSWIAMAPLIAILVHGLVDVPYFKNDLAIVFWLLVFLTTVSLDQEPVKR